MVILQSDDLNDDCRRLDDLGVGVIWEVTLEEIYIGGTLTRLVQRGSVQVNVRAW